MLDLSVKQLFFDARRVTDAVDRARKRALSKAGAFVRQRAKTSIRKRKKPSPPGKPPSSHVGLLRNFIFFGYDPHADSVVIGPAPMKRAAEDVPNILEFGGRVKTRRPRFIRVRKAAKGRKRRGPRVVKIPAGRTLKYKPRPYMGPALKAEAPKLPSLWANSVKGA